MLRAIYHGGPFDGEMRDIERFEPTQRLPSLRRPHRDAPPLRTTVVYRGTHRSADVVDYHYQHEEYDGPLPSP